MLFLLRYRRIPHRWCTMNAPEEEGTANAKGPVYVSILFVSRMGLQIKLKQGFVAPYSDLPPPPILVLPFTPHRLLPKMVWPDGTARNDSTFLIKHLEAEYHGRATMPQHPGLALISALLEDFADEFITKCMFHYRWIHDPV